MRKPKIDFKRAEWMHKFERLTTQQGIYQHGKVDWYTASYLYDIGATPELAVEKIQKALDEEKALFMEVK